MIITVCNTKGGVGKTTIAVNIAAAMAERGGVWLIDGDRQGTLQDAISIRNSDNKAPPLVCAHLPDGPALRGQVQAMGGKFANIVIDAGGRDSTSLRAALVLSDIILIPFAPRSYDVWALEQMHDLITEARSTRDGLKAYTVLNRADTRGTDNAEAAEAVADYQYLTHLDTVIGNRKAIAQAAGRGLAVAEHTPRDDKAREEFSNLFGRLF